MKASMDRYYDFTNTRIRRQGMHGYSNLKSRQWAKGALLYVVLFFVFALFYVWTRLQVTSMGYRLQRLADEGEKLEEIHHALTVEAATLKSPRRLEREASRLGLIKPAESQVVILADHKELP